MKSQRQGLLSLGETWRHWRPPVLGTPLSQERCAHPLKPPSRKSHLIHEPPHGAVGHLDAFSPQLLPDLQLAVATVEALVVDALNLSSQFLVTALTGRGRSGLGVVVGRGSELQSPADRLDSPTIPAGIDVANYFFVRPSSSVAKKIDASFKISFARRRSRTSRSSSFRR